jgi:hypothetical protein
MVDSVSGQSCNGSSSIVSSKGMNWNDPKLDTKVGKYTNLIDENISKAL